ncbi:MAG: hypothetical protein FJ272_04260 [Planctomycetes bacterium]|nr:hypothetical protein [Planctomycetota bacterium]
MGRTTATLRPDRKTVAWVEEIVEQKVFEMLGDPDAGLTLRPEVRRQLEKSFAAKQKGAKGIPAAEVARRLGLRW